jgi:hypothetical protein
VAVVYDRDHALHVLNGGATGQAWSPSPGSGTVTTRTVRLPVSRRGAIKRYLVGPVSRP